MLERWFTPDFAVLSWFSVGAWDAQGKFARPLLRFGGPAGFNALGCVGHLSSVALVRAHFGARPRAFFVYENGVEETGTSLCHYTIRAHRRWRRHPGRLCPPISSNDGVDLFCPHSIRAFGLSEERWDAQDPTALVWFLLIFMEAVILNDFVLQVVWGGKASRLLAWSNWIRRELTRPPCSSER